MIISSVDAELVLHYATVEGPAPAPRDAGPGARLAIDGLSKRFGERRVLEDVTLSIPPGEFVAVVGRSGCGKSTLLRLVAGLEQPSAGRIEVGGEALTGLRPDTRIMFQDARLLPWRRVIDNVQIGLPRHRREHARRVLEQVGLGERADEWPARLSGGQRQRVALARALVRTPELLLLDEPLGALDALTRIDMQQLIADLWQRGGFTALLVTHDVQEAIALADRVLLVEDGRVAMDLRVPLARPRDRGSSGFAALEAHVLERVMRPGVEAGPGHRISA